MPRLLAEGRLELELHDGTGEVPHHVVVVGHVEDGDDVQLLLRPGGRGPDPDVLLPVFNARRRFGAFRGILSFG